MTAHTYLLARWSEGEALRPVDPALKDEALTLAEVWAVVAAVSRRHAMRLYLEGVEGIRGADGRLERYGVLREGGGHV